MFIETVIGQDHGTPGAPKRFGRDSDSLRDEYDRGTQNQQSMDINAMNINDMLLLMDIDGYNINVINDINGY